MPITTQYLADLTKRREAEFQTDRITQTGREKSGIDALKSAIKQFGPGYGSGMEAKARSAATAGAIGSGLGGTTRPAAISAGLAGEFEDMRRGRLAGAMTNLGNFYGSYRNPYGVSAGDVTHAATGGFSGMMQESQLYERRAVEERARAERERSEAQARRDAEPSLQNWLDENFGVFDGGYSSGGSGGSGGGDMWDSGGGSGGGGGGSGGGSGGGDVSNPFAGIDTGSGTPTGNLLDDFAPEAAAEGMAAIQDIDMTALGMRGELGPGELDLSKVNWSNIEHGSMRDLTMMDAINAGVSFKDFLNATGRGATASNSTRWSRAMRLSTA